jgi:hypothetical protein
MADDVDEGSPSRSLLTVVGVPEAGGFATTTLMPSVENCQLHNGSLIDAQPSKVLIGPVLATGVPLQKYNSTFCPKCQIDERFCAKTVVDINSEKSKSILLKAKMIRFRLMHMDCFFTLFYFYNQLTTWIFFVFGLI